MKTFHCFAFAASFVLFGTTCLAGCSGGAEVAPPADPLDSPPDPNEPCSTLQNVAKPVLIYDVAEEPPPATGGTIQDGTYVVTNALRFTRAGGSSGPTKQTVQMTVRFRGNNAESIFDDVGRRVRFSIEGTTLRTTGLCPSTSVEDAPYSASGGTLSLYLNDSKGVRVYFLSRIQ